MGPINQELFSMPTSSNQTDIPITTETQTIQSESNNLFVLQAINFNSTQLVQKRGRGRPLTAKSHNNESKFKNKVNSCLNEYRHTGCTENKLFEENSPATENGSASFILAKRQKRHRKFK
ncbi:hypothetical protein BpHYR1_039010 [Brachionus plicatilis]|uniref:Uncharacterized protein n=1 Tax=Brachionus plicatilis TaxID=10195 RepID=A0A3M7T1V0_BRAPC|nr:hypothetical protein BpHYR1_039010 [Brachionus plicatilis]